MKRKFSLVWRLALALVFVLSMGLTSAIPVSAAAAQVESASILSPLTGNPVYTQTALASQTVHWTITTTADCSVYAKIEIVAAGGVVKGSFEKAYDSINTVVADDNHTFTFSPALTEGKYTAKITSYAYVTPTAVSTNTQTDAIIVDTTAPIVTITFPSLPYVDANFGQSGKQIAGTAADTVAPVDNVSVQISYEDNATTHHRSYWLAPGWGGDNITSWQPATGTTSWTYAGIAAADIAPPAFAAGKQFTVVARAFNRAGLKGTSSTKTFAIDVTSPTGDGPDHNQLIDRGFLTTNIPDELVGLDGFGGLTGYTKTQPATFFGHAYDTLSGIKDVIVSLRYHPFAGPDYYWDGYAWVAYNGAGTFPKFDLTVDGNGKWSIVAPTLTSGRIYVINAQAFDNAGNSLSDTVSFYFDTEAPNIQICTPDNGTYYEAFPMIAGTASLLTDVDLQITRVNPDNASKTQYWAPPSVLAEGSAPVYHWSDNLTWLAASGHFFWYSDFPLPTDTTGVTNGKVFTVIARAQDQASNDKTVSVRFTIDTVHPTITMNPIGLHTNNNYYVGAPPTITGTVSDAGSGVQKVKIDIDLVNPGAVTGVGAEDHHHSNYATITNGTWTYEVEHFRFWTGGTYLVTATAYDNTNLVVEATAEGAVIDAWGRYWHRGLTTDATQRFIYDAIPTVRIVYPFNYENRYDNVEGHNGFPTFRHDPYLNNLEEVSGFASDGFFGPGAVVGVDVKFTMNGTSKTYWNGTAWTSTATWLPATGSPDWGAVFEGVNSTFDIMSWEYTGTLPSFGCGNSYSISARAKDNIGQYSDIDTITFTWDITPPTVTIDGGVYCSMRAMGDIWGTATDLACGAGVDSVWVKIYPTCDNQTIIEKGQGCGDWKEAYIYKKSGNTVYWVLWATYANDFMGGSESYTVAAVAVDKSYDPECGLPRVGEGEHPRIFTGNMGQPVTQVFNFLRSDDSILLSNGWNFISFPKRLDSATDNLTEISLGCLPIDDAFGYDAQTGWYSLFAGAGINVLDGYWVHVITSYKDAEIAIGFNYSHNAMVVPAIKTLKGNAWNAIGPSGHKVGDQQEVSIEQGPAQAANQLISIEGSWSHMVVWNAEDQKYDETIFAPGHDHMNFGQGYWIFISNSAGDVLAALTDN